MEVVAAEASNTSYVTARHDVPSLLSSFFPTTSRVCRIPLTSRRPPHRLPKRLRGPTMVDILRCGKMLPPQLNLVIEIEFGRRDCAVVRERRGERRFTCWPLQAAVPAQPHEPRSTSTSSVLAGSYNDTVRVGRVGYLRHSFIAGFPSASQWGQRPLARPCLVPSNNWTAR